MLRIKHFWRFALLLTFLALPACQTIPGGPRPVLSEVTTDFAGIGSAIRSRCLDVNRQTAADSELQILRNDLITAYMLAADIEYGRYETRLLDEIRSNNFAASLSTLTLTAVATVSGNPELARGFTTAAGLIVAGQKAYTTDQLLNQTISVLQQQMRATRAAQRERILTKLGEPYQNWTFCLALQDAQAYERAGTLNAALAEIAATASEARRTNEANADAVVPMIPYDRGGLAQALRSFVYPTDRALWQGRLELVAALIEEDNLLPVAGLTPLVRRARILFGAGAENEAARRQLIEALIDDSRVDDDSKRLLGEALT